MRLLAACSICVVYAFSFCQLVAHASSHSISVNGLSIEIIDQEINVDCEVQYTVDDKVKAALSNGIEVSFIFELELRLDREIWPDSTVVALAREFRVKYHALSKQYVMVETDNNFERSFPDLYSAFFYQGHLRNVVLANIDVLALNQQYYVRARARLLSENLPLPLRIKSYFSEDWRPSSGWTIWPM